MKRLLLSSMMGTVIISRPIASRGFASANSAKNSIQLIYDQLCSITNFEESVNRPFYCPKVRACLDYMERVSLEDLGLSLMDIKSCTHSQCATLVETSKFDIAIFMLPQGKLLPVHDHPHMTVLSKVIIGELQVKSFTPIQRATYHDYSSSITSVPTPAKLEMDCIKTVNDPAWLLSPSHGNYHEFKALTPCLIFDVLMPPYIYPDRSCTYYSVSRDEASGSFNLAPTTLSASVELPYSVPYKGFVPRRSFFR